MRFQADPGLTATAPAPVAAESGYALASVDSTPAYLGIHHVIHHVRHRESPEGSDSALRAYRNFASLSASSGFSGSSAQPVDDEASPSAPTLAYAEPAPPPASRPAAAGPAVVAHAPPARPASASNAILNSAQIASLHDRLKLSSYQQQLWLPVESALRDISYHNDKSRKTSYRTAKQPPLIDTGSAEVQRLKSAAIPLIMSMNEDQKQEVRTMARLMGLEQLASQF